MPTNPATLPADSGKLTTIPELLAVALQPLDGPHPHLAGGLGRRALLLADLLEGVLLLEP
jgi:hypothetical protein